MLRTSRRAMAISAAFLAFSFLAATAEAQKSDQSATKEQIANLFDRWNQALLTGNPVEVAKLYADDAVLLPTVSPKVRHDRAGLEEYFDHFLKLKPVGKMVEQHIRIYGDTAINSGLYDFTITEDGVTKEVPARFTFVYHKDGDRWLIVEHHSSVSPQHAAK